MYIVRCHIATVGVELPVQTFNFMCFRRGQVVEQGVCLLLVNVLSVWLCHVLAS